MTRIYLAGPLFCQGEKEFNIMVSDFLISNGHDVLLPQSIHLEDVFGDPDLTDDEKSMEVFRRDIRALDGCDVLVYVMDGRVPDEGAAVELGYAYANGMPCIGFKTDVRTAEYGRDNAMLVGALGTRIARDLEGLLKMLDGL
jgi:nucleoside 2-deoxyribosyltransferase